MARIQITPDSLKLINRITKHIDRDFEDVENTYGYLKLRKIRRVLVGQISLENQNMSSIITENKYLLLTKTKETPN